MASPARTTAALAIAAALGLVVAAGAVAAPALLAPAAPPSSPVAVAGPTEAAEPTPSVASPSPSPTWTASGVTVAQPVADSGVLRVYSNNIENLVTNNPDGSCTRVTRAEHLESILVDGRGRTGTATVEPPDLLMLQQVSGSAAADAYADALSERFGFPVGRFRALVAWDDPEPWGADHDCGKGTRPLGDLKSRQTNAIIYDTATLALADSEMWSAGWLPSGEAYRDGRGCVAYELPHADTQANRRQKWKRTSALAARFTLIGSDQTVFAATMHLPQQNRDNACAGEDDPGIEDSGLRLDDAALALLDDATIAVIGADANRTGISPEALQGFGMTGYGTTDTIGRSKIDYLFVRGQVRPSPIGHTVPGTKSNHRALYGFIDY
jgi:hypothetical protein